MFNHFLILDKRLAIQVWQKNSKFSSPPKPTLMKFILLAFLSLLVCFSAAFSQVVPEKESWKKPLPPPSVRDKSSPPLRGEKDMRPKQFNIQPGKLTPINISSHIHSFARLKTGDSTKIPVAGIETLKLQLKYKKVSAASTAYSFKVNNPAYQGAWVFINEIKNPATQKKQYIGHLIRKGYSDALKLKDENGKLYFVIDEHENIVQD